MIAQGRKTGQGQYLGKVACSSRSCCDRNCLRCSLRWFFFVLLLLLLILLLPPPLLTVLLPHWLLN